MIPNYHTNALDLNKNSTSPKLFRFPFPSSYWSPLNLLLFGFKIYSHIFSSSELIIIYDFNKHLDSSASDTCVFDAMLVLNSALMDKLVPNTYSFRVVL